MYPKYTRLCEEAKQRNKDVDSVALLGQFFTLSAELTNLCFANLSQFELMEGRFVAMLMIEGQGSMPPHEIATLSGLTRASITSTIDSLEKKGLAVRQASQTDRRSLTVKLTAEGKAILDQTINAQLDWLENIVATLNDSEKAALQSIMAKVSTHMKL